MTDGKHLETILLPALLALIPSCFGGHLHELAVEMQTFSFSNSPILVNPVYSDSASGISIEAEAVYVNDCYADAGADVYHVDIPSESSQMSRIFILMQRSPPEGCPEIFSPTTRPVTISSDSKTELSDLQLLDHALASADGPPIRPPVIIPHAGTAGSHFSVQAGAHENSRPLAPTGIPLEPLEAAHTTLSDDAAHRMLSLVVQFPEGAAPLEAMPLSFYVFESRTALGEINFGRKMHWVMVVRQEGRPADSKPWDSAFTVPLGLASGSGSRLFIVNPMPDHRGSVQLSPFQAVD